MGSEAQGKKDSELLTVGSECGNTDNRTAEEQKILNRRFTQINAEQQTAKRQAHSAKSD